MLLLQTLRTCACALTLVASSACTFGSLGGGAPPGVGSTTDADGSTSSAVTEPGTDSGDPTTITITTSSADADADTTGPSPRTCADDWWNAAWRARVPITAAAELIVDDFTDVPLLVVLDPERIDTSAVAPDGADLRFVDATGGLLAHEIERWDPASSSFVWVRVPALTNGTAAGLYLYYDGPTDDPPAPTDTWSSSHAAVWHFASIPGVLESTANAVHGTATGTETVAGRVGSGLGFPGDGEHRVAMTEASGALMSGWDAFTISLWIRPEYGGDAEWQAAFNAPLVHKGGALNYGRAWRESWQDAGLGFFQIDFYLASGGSATQRFEIPRDAWTHLAYVFDGAALYLYRDGELVLTHPFSPGGPTMTGGQPLMLGDWSHPMRGAIDELRFETVARSQAWLRLQLRSMRDALFEIGDRESCL